MSSPARRPSTSPLTRDDDFAFGARLGRLLRFGLVDFSPVMKSS